MNIITFQNEKQLLEHFIAKLYILDPDILVSHNLTGGVLELILARIQYCKVNHWSRIGRFKRSTVPNRKIEQGGGGSGSNNWISRNVTCGRLLVDTFLSSVELLNEVNYDLTHLAQS